MKEVREIKRNGETYQLGNMDLDNSIESTMWLNMIKRSSNIKFKNSHLAYQNCKMSENFKNYEFFYNWLHENDIEYYINNKIPFCIDSDILTGSNKLYSEKTCLLIPISLNKYIGKIKQALDTNQMYSNKSNKYQLFLNVKGKLYSFETYSSWDNLKLNHRYIACYKIIKYIDNANTSKKTMKKIKNSELYKYIKAESLKVKDKHKIKIDNILNYLN